MSCAVLCQLPLEFTEQLSELPWPPVLQAAADLPVTLEEPERGIFLRVPCGLGRGSPVTVIADRIHVPDLYSWPCQGLLGDDSLAGSQPRCSRILDTGKSAT